MSLCNRLIGGIFDRLDTIASFWQTPREVEWAKAAAASGEPCEGCGHRIHDSNVCPVGECLCLGWFPDRAKSHAAADGLAEREAEEEVAEPRYADDDEFRAAYANEKPRWAGLAERLTISDGPPVDMRDIRLGDKYCLLCNENITFVSYHACPVLAKTSATTPGAESGPAEGEPPEPSAGVGPKMAGPSAESRACRAAGPFDCLGCGMRDACTYPAHSAAVESPASVPAAECSAPEFDWVTTAIPVIAGVLAEHVPRTYPGTYPATDHRVVYCGHADISAEFADMQDWRDHVAPHIAAALQTPGTATIHDFPSGDRPRPLADFPKHQK